MKNKELIQENPLMVKLKSLNLPPNDFAIFGSGPMFAHGLKSEIRDLDVIARGAAWEKIKEIKIPEETRLKFGEVAELFDGEIEIYNGWVGNSDIDKFINEAEIIDGIKFVRLEEVLKWKKERALPKDVDDIRLIEEYLASR